MVYVVLSCVFLIICNVLCIILIVSLKRENKSISILNRVLLNKVFEAKEDKN